MATENKASFIVDLKGNVSQKARTFGSDISAMSNKGSLAMRGMATSTNTATLAFSSFSKKIMAFAASGALLAAAKKTVNYVQDLTELATQFNLTAEQSDKLERTLSIIAGKRAIAYSELSKAIEDVLKRTNDFNSTIANADNVALAMKGIGLSAEDAGNKIGILVSKKWSATEIHDFLNYSANISKIGSGNLSEQFNKVIDVINTTNWNSPKQAREIFSIERLGASAVGSSGGSATVVQQLNTALQDVDKRNILRAHGVEPLNSETGELIDPIDLILKFGTAAKFNGTNISDIIGGDAIPLIKSLKDEASQQRLKDSVVSKNNNLIDAKAETNANTLEGSVTKAYESATQWVYRALKDPIIFAGNAAHLYFNDDAQDELYKALPDDSLIKQMRFKNRGLNSNLSDELKDILKTGGVNNNSKVSGNISIHVSSDNNLTVKPVGVKSSGVNLSVDTGSIRNGAY